MEATFDLTTASRDRLINYIEELHNLIRKEDSYRRKLELDLEDMRAEAQINNAIDKLLNA